MRQKWQGEWEQQSEEIVDCKRKLHKIYEEQEDVDILRESL